MNKPKRLTSDQLPWSTSNAALAFSLYMAGIPFSDDQSPLVNLYDAEILRGLGYSGKVEEATLRAFADGKRGMVEYGFQRAAELTECLKAFDDQKASKNTAEDVFKAIWKRLHAGAVCPQEAITRAVCVIVSRWREDLTRWESMPGFQDRKRKNRIKDADAGKTAIEVFLAGSFAEFAAVVMDARKEFLNLFKRYQPSIRLGKKGRAVKTGDKVKFPGFIVYSPDATGDTRKHLKI